MPIEWPPAYTLRASSRARYVQLRITKHRGLEIIAPGVFDKECAVDLLQRHRRWIERVWERTQPVTSNLFYLPEQITLPALETTWQVVYEPVPDTEQVYLRVTNERELRLQGNVRDYRKCQLVICNYLRKTAADALLPWLAQLSAQTQLYYTSARIGSAATRWGSCSAKKRITLNWHLLFLPKELAQHVLLHELCHTVALDHSPRFWNLLTNVDPHTAVLRKALKSAGRYLPDWIGEE